MRRRDFIKVIVGSAPFWPLVAHAQQSNQMRRIGVMTAIAEDDPEALLRVTTLREELLKLGWTEGRLESTRRSSVAVESLKYFL